MRSQNCCQFSLFNGKKKKLYGHQGQWLLTKRERPSYNLVPSTVQDIFDQGHSTESYKLRNSDSVVILTLIDSKHFTLIIIYDLKNH